MNKLFSFVLLLGLVLTIGCSKFVDGLEFSPNEPTSANPPLLTTVSQVQMFNTYAGQFARMTNILSQQCAGTLEQYRDIAQYAIQEGDNNNEFALIYSTINDCNLLIDQSTTSPHYAGIGKIMKAMNLAVATDIWGDVPNKEAAQGVKGAANFNPAYDSQQSIYEDMQSLLSAAITDLGAATSTLSPGSDDLIFGGDLGKWKATAWALKARYANRLSKRDAAGSATKALEYVDAALAAGFTSHAGDCNAIFPGEGNSLNQWFGFEQTRANYIQTGGTLVDIMNSINDPRVPVYFGMDAAGGYSGTALGTFTTTTSDVGAYFASANSNSPIITYAELKFIEAEAALRATNPTRAATAYNEAVIAHITHITGAAPSAAYVASQASATMATITLGSIMTHKYVATFTQLEGYNDWRRTGIPALVPNPDPDAAVAGIPQRFPTPSNERLYNQKAVVTSDILKKVWWAE